MPRRVLQGIVTSDVNEKTVTVEVQRRFTHPVYKKIIVRSKNYLAHDESNKVKTGDRVRIRECRPMSRRKRWEVITDAADAAKA